MIAVRNEFFGGAIDVAGLVTGGDIIRQLKGRVGDRLLIPEVMLRYGGVSFLDDVTPAQVEQELGVPLTVVASDGASLLDAMML